MGSPAKAWLRALEATAAVERGRSPIFPIIIEDLAERFDAAPALLSRDSSLTYRALAGAAARYARWGLAQGLRPGECVCLLMPNCPEYLAIWLGLSRIGVTVALLNTHLRGELLAHAVHAASPRGLIVAGTLAGALTAARAGFPAGLRCWAHGGADAADLPRLDAQLGLLSAQPLTAAECAVPALTDRALCIYTSGTTGTPKAANVSHYRLVQWTHWFAGLLDLRPQDRMYDCLPMYHSIGGVVAAGAPLVRGAAVVIRERFSAQEFWADVVGERCTLFQYIGELCRYLVAAPPHPQERQHALRLCSGNGLRADVWEQFQSRFRIPAILEYYAATEGSFSLYNVEGRRGAIGRIPPFLAQRTAVTLLRVDADSGVPVRGADGWCERCLPEEPGEAIGRLAATADAAGGHFEGYAEAQAAGQKVLRNVFEPGDAWYRSGDLLRQDAQGFFYFVDRCGDTFRWKGENVATTEVAAVLGAAPGVQDAAVYGVAVPNSEGRAGMAALVVDAQFELAQFRAHVAARLPEYARPLFLRIAPALELTGTLRHRGRELARQGFDPALVADPLYFDDRVRGNYVALDTTLLAGIRAGSVRL